MQEIPRPALLPVTPLLTAAIVKNLMEAGVTLPDGCEWPQDESPLDAKISHGTANSGAAVPKITFEFSHDKKTGVNNL